MQSARAGLIGTVVVHAGLFAAAFWIARDVSEPVQMVHAITLIAAPAPVEDASSKSVSTSTPVKTAKTAPILKPRKTPEKPKPVPKNQPEKPLPTAVPNTGRDVTNLKIEGIGGKYPDYEANIINRALTEFAKGGPRPPLETEVAFTIHPDGSVTDITTVRGSSSYSFNSDARAAIEAVGRTKGFGPLPGGLSEMRVNFTFKPDRP